MSFNYYAKMVKILSTYENYYIIKYNIKCQTKRFDGQYNDYTHYYKIYDIDDNYIKYTKFYQIEVLAKYLKITPGMLELLILKEADHE